MEKKNYTMKEIAQIVKQEYRKFVTEHRILTTVIAIALVVLVIMSMMDPVVLSIKDNSGHIRSGTGWEFYEDSYARYYMYDPTNTTVIYLNRAPEDIETALDNGHITLDDLDEQGIAYYVKPKDDSFAYWSTSRFANWLLGY